MRDDLYPGVQLRVYISGARYSSETTGARGLRRGYEGRSGKGMWHAELPDFRRNRNARHLADDRPGKRNERGEGNRKKINQHSVLKT